MPADITNTPRSSNSSIVQPSRSASISRQSNAAIGLRQVLPVQTNNTSRLESRCKVRSGTTPARRISYRPPATRTTDDGWPNRHGPSSTTRLTWSPKTSRICLAVTASGMPERLALVSVSGPASIRNTARIIGWPGTRRPIDCCGRDRLPHARRQLTHETLGVRIVDHQRDRPRPASPRKPPAHRAQVGGIVAGLVGALDRQRQRFGLRPAFHRQQPADGLFVQALAARP